MFKHEICIKSITYPIFNLEKLAAARSLLPALGISRCELSARYASLDRTRLGFIARILNGCGSYELRHGCCGVYTE
jgi:hypothetical protein